MGCGNWKVDEFTPTDLKIGFADKISMISKSIVKLDYPNKKCFGFLIKFFKEDKDFFCLLTAEENISKDVIEKKRAYKIFL